MIQTDTCDVCGGGIYRDVQAAWDSARWWHMDPHTVTVSHIAYPHPRSNDDDTDDRPTGR